MCFKSADIIFFIRDIYVRSQIIVSAWVLTPPVNHNPTISSVPPGTENRNKYRRQTKSLDNSNKLNMFNSNTYTSFKTAYKHMLILRWCHGQELFGSQIPVTTL